MPKTCSRRSWRSLITCDRSFTKSVLIAPTEDRVVHEPPYEGNLPRHNPNAIPQSPYAPSRASEMHSKNSHSYSPSPLFSARRDDVTPLIVPAGDYGSVSTGLYPQVSGIGTVNSNSSGTASPQRDRTHTRGKSGKVSASPTAARPRAPSRDVYTDETSFVAAQTPLVSSSSGIRSESSEWGPG